MDHSNVVHKCRASSGTVQTLKEWEYGRVTRTWKGEWSRQDCLEGPVTYSPGAPTGSARGRDTLLTFLFLRICWCLSLAEFNRKTTGKGLSMQSLLVSLPDTEQDGVGRGYPEIPSTGV